MDVTDQLRSRLRDSRSRVTRRGHEWDVADVVAVLVSEPEQMSSRDPELHAILATYSTRRVQSERALGLVMSILRRIEPGSGLHRTLTEVARLLDVPEAGLRLDRYREDAGGTRTGQRPTNGPHVDWTVR